MQARGWWITPQIGRTPPPDTGPALPACRRCGHPGSVHRRPGRCSRRDPWRHLWRRCDCAGYTPREG